MSNSTLIEAQWHGRPVVATKIGACVTCVPDGGTGLLCTERT